MTEFSDNPFRCSAEVDASALLTQANIWTAIQTFQKGINLTGLASPPSITNGHIYHYDKRFYIDSANRRAISRSSDALISPVVIANTTDETLLWEGGVSVDTLAAGKVYRVSAFGKFSTTNASSSLTLRTKLNNIEIASLTSNLGNVTDVAGCTQATLTIRTLGTTGTVACFSSFQLDEKTFIANNSSITFDTTAGNDLEITAQWNIAHTENSASIDQGFLEAMN